MKCPNCGENEAFWIYGMYRAIYKCDNCSHEFDVDLDRWDQDEKKSGKKINDGTKYIVDDD